MKFPRYIFSALFVLLCAAVSNAAPAPRLISSTYFAGMSPDEALVALYDHAGQGAVWSMKTGALLNRGIGDNMVFSPDGRVFASGKRDFIFGIYDRGTGLPIHNLRATCPWMESQDTRDKVARMEATDSRNAQYMYLTGETREATRVRFSPDGRLIATSGCGNSVYVWSVLTGNLVHTLESHLRDGYEFAFSPDSGRIISWGPGHRLLVWSLESGKVVLERRDVEVIASTPNMQRLALSDFEARNVKIFDPAAGGETAIKMAPNSVGAAAFDSGGNVLVVSDTAGGVTAWSAATGARLLRTGNQAGPAGEARTFAVGPRRLRLAIENWEDDTVEVYSMKDWALMYTVPGHARAADHIAFSSGGEVLVTAGGGVLNIRTAASGSLIHSGELEPDEDPAEQFAMSPDGRRVAYRVAGREMILVWPVYRDAPISGLRFAPEHLGGLQFSPGGSFVVMSGSGVNVRLWNIKTGREATMNLLPAGDGWVVQCLPGLFDFPARAHDYLDLNLYGFWDDSLPYDYYSPARRPGLLARFASGNYAYDEMQPAPEAGKFAFLTGLSCDGLPEEGVEKLVGALWETNTCVMCMACGCRCSTDCYVRDNARIRCAFESCGDDTYTLEYFGRRYDCHAPEAQSVKVW